MVLGWTWRHPRELGFFNTDTKTDLGVMRTFTRMHTHNGIHRNGGPLTGCEWEKERKPGSNGSLKETQPKCFVAL